MINIEKRKYHRTVTEVFVQFFEESDENMNHQYQEGVVENCSAGGMYISTDHPCPRGSTIILKFRLESRIKDLLPIKVRAAVRWTRHVTNPKGMGIEFLEFEGIDKRDFQEWITSLLG
jgi:c-di-GMP-binding flagellar brake protein YcgR